MSDAFGVWGMRPIIHSVPETWNTRCDGCQHFECTPQERSRLHPWKYRCNKLGVNFEYKRLFSIDIDECPERKYLRRKDRW